MTRTGLAAPAKVNLQLAVTGRRDDGHHEIDSLAVFAGLSDGLALERAATSSVTEVGEHARPPSGTFTEAAGIGTPCAAEITKRIPVAAGLGGGSADAAAALVLLNRVHGAPLDAETLGRVGLAVGADVPVCLRSHDGGGGTGWRMRGVGEVLDSVVLPEGLGLVLVNGGHAVSTESVFAALDAAGVPGGRRHAPEYGAGALGTDALGELVALGNDLRDAAVSVCPGIRDTLKAVEGLSGVEGFVGAGMSGSGATCFALFGTRAEAEAAAPSVGGAQWCWAGGLHTG